MNNAHTPGPWTIQQLEQGKNGYESWNTYCIRDAKTNVHIATVGDVDRFFEDRNEKHAALIAAAPELLQALIDIAIQARSLEGNALHGLDARKVGKRIQDLTQAAIAKATQGDNKGVTK